MKLIDLLSLSSRNLLRRKTRTTLAVLGVVVGIVSIIVMMSIGFGLTKSYQNMLESYGNLHLIEIYNYNSSSDAKLDDSALSKISKTDGVDAVTPVISAYVTIYDENSGKRLTNSVTGIDASVWEKFNYSLAEGKNLSKDDTDGVLFGNNVVSWFYYPDGEWTDEALDVMNADLYLTFDQYYELDYDWVDKSNYPDYPLYEIRAVGVLANPNDDSSYSLYMDIDALKEYIQEAQSAEEGTEYEGNTSSGMKGEGKDAQYQNAYVYVSDINRVEDISQEIKDMGFQTYSATDWLEQAKSTLGMIELILGGIGGISLLVAAIGIANTMIMSVYERTKEIGVMKVIGSSLRDIKNMFLIEAGMIGLSGGIAGIIVSFLISFAMNHFLKDLMASFIGIEGENVVVSVIPFWLVLAAMAFSFMVGVISGVSPANKACKMSALDSLRNE